MKNNKFKKNKSPINFNVIIIFMLCIILVLSLTSNLQITINNGVSSSENTTAQSEPQWSHSTTVSQSTNVSDSALSSSTVGAIAGGVSHSISIFSDTNSNSVTSENQSVSHTQGFVSQSENNTAYPEMDISKFYKTGKKINLKEKTPIEFNFNGMSNKVENIILTIFKGVQNTKTGKYETLAPELTKEEVRAIKSFFKLYFGRVDDLEHLFVIANNNNGLSKISVSVDVFNMFNAQRNAFYTKIDEALSQMEDGEDEYILYQISLYIRDHVVYTDDHYNVADAIKNGEGVCNSYALLFKLMAERVGIPTDACFGYVKEGYHAWNRAQLKSGIYKYYDITFYDTGYDLKYVGCGESIHDLRAINVYLY